MVDRKEREKKKAGGRKEAKERKRKEKEKGTRHTQQRKAPATHSFQLGPPPTVSTIV